MTVTITPGGLRGSVCAPASKSAVHRLLLCAALAEDESRLHCASWSEDIQATARCLRALGAEVAQAGEWICVSPIRAGVSSAALRCGESGSTLRLLLPVAAALGVQAGFQGSGRLPSRPIEPLAGELVRHGCSIWQEGDTVWLNGRLRNGDYTLPGDVSSQFISGLLFALPLLEGDSTLEVTGDVESQGYIAMTEQTIRSFGVRFTREGWRYHIPGRQRYRTPGRLIPEGDWSAAAVWLAAGALSGPVTVTGLDMSSLQEDKQVVELLRALGAEITWESDGVTASKGRLAGLMIDGAQIPDVIPALCVAAAGAEGESRVHHAARLRLKESDRLDSTAQMLCSLGARAAVQDDGLTVTGNTALTGGTAPCAGDHRIVMAAAAASILCEAPVVIPGAQAVRKSYPQFFDDFTKLGGRLTTQTEGAETA